MTMCKPHWDKLREAIIMKGLSHLISKDGEVLMSRMAKQTHNVENLDSYDPLMAAFMAIMSNALTQGGFYLLTEDLCPLCELDTYRPTDPLHSDNWIEKATEEQLKYCRDKGWVPHAS
jgi:hypothetical protein